MATEQTEEFVAAPSEKEALFGTIPVTRDERVWGFFDFSWVMIGLAIATWAFLIGGDVVYFLGLKAGIAAMVVGNAIGVGVVVMSVLGDTKYGLEHFSMVRAVFGRHGIKPLIYIINFLICIGWSGILAVMLGRAGVNVVNELAGTEFGGDSYLVALFGLAALFSSWLVVVKGPVALKWFNRIAAPGLSVVIVVMLSFLFKDNSWGDFTAIEPLEPFGDPLLVGIFLGLSALLLIKPSAVYDNFFQFLYWISLAYAPVIGIVLVDYFILRRQTLDLRAIFSHRKGSPYDFWGGWNIAAYIGVAVGVGVYLLLLNPVSLWYSAPFAYMTASVPSLVSGGLVYRSST